MSAGRVLFCGVGFGHGGLASSFPPVAAALERLGYEVKVQPPHSADRGRLGVAAGCESAPAFRFGPCGLWAGRALRLFHLLTGGAFRFLLARKVPHDAFIVYGASCCMEWCGYSTKPTWAFLHSAPEIGFKGPLRAAIVRDLRRSAARARHLRGLERRPRRLAEARHRERGAAAAARFSATASRHCARPSALRLRWPPFVGEGGGPSSRRNREGAGTFA